MFHFDKVVKKFSYVAVISNLIIDMPFDDKNNNLRCFLINGLAKLKDKENRDSRFVFMNDSVSLNLDLKNILHPL